jgi:ADP-ribosylglycohydrolase
MAQSSVNKFVLDLYRHGDRIGSCFEGQSTWRVATEEQIQKAMKSIQGSDESSIVDCFLAYSGRILWYGNMNDWLWGWLSYHQDHHYSGYGSTYRDHFALVQYLVQEKMPVVEKIEKVQFMAAEDNSFGNACLALVYPLYQYARENISECSAREVVLLFTRCTHTHEDAIKAVNLLMDIIDGKAYVPPTEEYLRENRCAELPTAFNTLLTAMYIADVETEDEVIRRGIYVSGDTDSTLATAMMLWAMKEKRDFN